jgi:hypothetical protein
MRSKRITAGQKGTIPWTPAERWVQRGIIGLVALLAVLVGCISIRQDSERTLVAAGSDIRLPLKDLKPEKLRLITCATIPTTTIPVAIQRADDRFFARHLAPVGVVGIFLITSPSESSFAVVAGTS